RDFLSNQRGGYITLVARSAGDPAAIVPALRNAVWSFNKNLPISEVLTMEEVVAMATAQPRFEVALLVAFATAALLLAAAGIYALMSFSVSRRVHEIGIRISLGASQKDVTLAVLRQGMALALAGSVAGALGALLLSRVMSGMLFGI